MKGVILSHTRMGKTNSGFCTNILLVYRDGSTVQVRPRLPPNGNLFVDSFGMDDGEMIKKWKPGCWVKLPKIKNIRGYHARPTHPEDVVLVDYENVVVGFRPKEEKSGFIKLIRPFCYLGIDELFPDAKKKPDSFDKWYVPGGLNLDRSVGYVHSRKVEICVYFDTFQARITDMNNNFFNAPLKDEHLLRKLEHKKCQIQLNPLVYKNKLVRLSLANPWNEGNALGEFRCFVMVSHIVK